MDVIMNPLTNLAAACLRVIGNFFALFSILVEDVRQQHRGKAAQTNAKTVPFLKIRYNRTSTLSTTKSSTKSFENGTVSRKSKKVRRPQPPYYMCLSNYLCHATLIFFGHFNDFLRRIGLLESIEHVEKNRADYPMMYSSFASFYVRNIIARMRNMWSHPIAALPGGEIEILERQFGPYNAEWAYTGGRIKAINMGSYNYLGYAENKGQRIDNIISDIPIKGVGVGTSPNELGTHEGFFELEKKVARYLNTEDAMLIGMGFATNSQSLPCLFGPGCLVLGDQHNHASLALGCKLSGAKVKVFRHNDMRHLENILRESIAYGQPAKQGAGVRLPWRKIIIIVEGIYSMEGTIVNLHEVVRLKNKYGAYLYMDEAHSIGAMGPNGRGICDYYNINPNEIDILMGTFTKSFSAAGGYIAGKKTTIEYIRSCSPSFYYCSTMAQPVVGQISSIMDQFLAMNNEDKNNNSKLTSEDKVVLVDDIRGRISQLKRNTAIFRSRLRQLGFHIDGHDDSPVVPVMVYTPTNLKCLIYELLQRGVATTGAAFPVTSLLGIRARFCLSASHTDEMIEKTLELLESIGTKIGIRFDAKL